MQNIASQRSSFQPLLCTVFIGAQSHTIWVLELQSLFPPINCTDIFSNHYLWRLQLILSKALIVNHIFRLSHNQRLQANRDTHLLGRTFQRPTDHLTVAEGKVQISLWIRLILHYTSTL